MPRKEAEMDKLLNKAEAAEMLSVSESTLDRIIGDGDLPMYKIRGSCRIKTSDIEKYLESCVLHCLPVAARKPRAKASGNAHPCLYVPGMKVV